MTRVTVQGAGRLQSYSGRQPLEVDYLGSVGRYSVEIETEDATIRVELSQIEAIGLLIGLRGAVEDAEEQREEFERAQEQERRKLKVRRLRDVG